MLRRYLCSILLLLGVLVVGAPARAADCFDVRVDYMGRDYLGAIAGIGYYRWHYRVTGETCDSKTLSHWVLQLCQNYWPNVSEVSTLSVDSSDLPDGTDTYYTYSIGVDPTTGIAGIKWNSDHGNILDKANEYDDFSFVSPGSEELVTVAWGSKAGQILEFGNTIGPSCNPVGIEHRTWGSIKTMYRN